MALDQNDSQSQQRPVKRYLIRLRSHYIDYCKVRNRDVGKIIHTYGEQYDLSCTEEQIQNLADYALQDDAYLHRTFDRSNWLSASRMLTTINKLTGVRLRGAECCSHCGHYLRHRLPDFKAGLPAKPTKAQKKLGA